MNDDLISRQAVIDIIHRFFTEEVDKIPTKKTEDGEVLIMCKAQPLFAMNKAICKRIKALPSVSPTQNCVGNALDMRCDDAISRQWLMECVNEGWIKFDTEKDENRFIHLIRDVAPPVTPYPKMGQWIYGEDNLGTGRDGWYCNQCGHFEFWDYKLDMKSAKLNLPNICPDCGAKMFEPQEGANE